MGGGPHLGASTYAEETMMAWYAQWQDGEWPLGDGTVPDTHRMWAADGSTFAAALTAAGQVEVHAPGQPPAPDDPDPEPPVVDVAPDPLPAPKPPRHHRGR